MFGVKKAWRLWPWLALGALLGCSGAATVPAPLAEIPSSISIPDEVAIDVSKVSSNPGASAGLRWLKALTSEELLSIIRIGPDTIRTINEEVLPGLLLPFSQIEIPVSPQTTVFQGQITENDGNKVTFKFDFSDYDFDGDGAKDGFTGCTCPVGCALESCPAQAPVADLRRVGFRIWANTNSPEVFDPVMAGFFDFLPVKDDPTTSIDEENPGKGQFRVGSIDRTEFEGSVTTERFLIGVIYDHGNSAAELDKSTQAFLLNDSTDSGGQVVFSNRSNSLVAQLAKTDPDGGQYLEKTVQTNFEAFMAAGLESPEEQRELQLYIGRFREDADFWSGSVVIENPDQSLNVPTTCARISTATEVDQEICIDLGIDTSGESFLRGALESDVLFPPDFPPNPPF